MSDSSHGYALSQAGPLNGQLCANLPQLVIQQAHQSASQMPQLVIQQMPSSCAGQPQMQPQQYIVATLPSGNHVLVRQPMHYPSSQMTVQRTVQQQHMPVQMTAQYHVAHQVPAQLTAPQFQFPAQATATVAQYQVAQQVAAQQQIAPQIQIDPRLMQSGAGTLAAVAGHPMMLACTQAPTFSAGGGGSAGGAAGPSRAKRPAIEDPGEHKCILGQLVLNNECQLELVGTEGIDLMGQVIHTPQGPMRFESLHAPAQLPAAPHQAGGSSAPLNQQPHDTYSIPATAPAAPVGGGIAAATRCPDHMQPPAMLPPPPRLQPAGLAATPVTSSPLPIINNSQVVRTRPHEHLPNMQWADLADGNTVLLQLLGAGAGSDPPGAAPPTSDSLSGGPASQITQGQQADMSMQADVGTATDTPETAGAGADTCAAATAGAYLPPSPFALPQTAAINTTSQSNTPAALPSPLAPGAPTTSTPAPTTSTPAPTISTPAPTTSTPAPTTSAASDTVSLGGVKADAGDISTAMVPWAVRVMCAVTGGEGSSAQEAVHMFSLTGGAPSGLAQLLPPDMEVAEFRLVRNVDPKMAVETPYLMWIQAHPGHESAVRHLMAAQLCVACDLAPGLQVVLSPQMVREQLVMLCLVLPWQTTRDGISPQGTYQQLPAGMQQGGEGQWSGGGGSGGGGDREAELRAAAAAVAGAMSVLKQAAASCSAAAAQPGDGTC